LLAQAGQPERKFIMNDTTATLNQIVESIEANRPAPILTTEGHVLSLKNTLFLLGQCELLPTKPTVVGGFKQWRTKGRTVKKGEVSLKIYVPVSKKSKRIKDEEGEDVTFTRFQIISVFDISQTTELNPSS
jgi:hypothetical protein